MDASIVSPLTVARSPQAALLYLGLVTISTVVWSIKKLAQNKNAEIDLEKRLGKERYKNEIMFAVCGRVNTGKSSLINAIRGLKDHDGQAAKVSDQEETVKISKFEWLNKSIYDFPGSGTLVEPDDDFFMRRGLCRFHGIILLRDSAIQQADIKFARKAAEFNVPIVFVQSRMDEIMNRRKRDRQIKEINPNTIRFIISHLRENHRQYMEKHAPDLAHVPCFFISSDAMRELMKFQKSMESIDDINRENMSALEEINFFEEDKLINQLLIMMWQSCDQVEKIQELRRQEEISLQADEIFSTLDSEENLPLESTHSQEKHVKMEEAIEKLLDDLRESVYTVNSENSEKQEENSCDLNDDFEILYDVPSSTDSNDELTKN